MKTSTFLTLAAIGKLAAAHATFQEIWVNGKSQGTKGVRGTSNANNPIYSTADALASDMMICKGGSKVADSVSVAGGDKLTLEWHHNNPRSSGDAEDPIASSHKGPIIVWVAKASTNGQGNAWVKIQESGLNGGTWAVDTFRANGGKIDVTLPDLAAGDYLIRSEIIALHEGNNVGKAQFYNGCGQITVTSSGSKTITNGADITKVYTPNDKGVHFDIYSGATSYTIPGPAVGAGFGAGSGAAQPTKAADKPATKPTATTLATVTKPTATPAAGGATVAKYGQCGGNGYTGSKTCASGSTCTKQNDYYHQCL